MFWRGVIGYLPVNVVQGVTGLLGLVVFTRLLPPAQYGVYALAFSVMSLVYTLSFTWLEAAMARFYAAEAEARALPNHYATLYRSFAGLALGLALPVAVALWLWPMPAELKFAIAVGLVSIPIRSLAKLGQERRRAAGDVRGAALLDVFMTSVGFLAGAGLAWGGLGGAAPLAGGGAGAAHCQIW
jgi:O-antigen/teichoic acid export membrane protein